MLIDASKFNWSQWTQPIFDSNTTWGDVSASSVHQAGDFDAYHALDENEDTRWEAGQNISPSQFIWRFEKPLKLYRIELVNKYSGSNMVTKNVRVFADEAMETLVAEGTFEATAKSVLNFEPEQPVPCDCLVLDMDTYNQYIGLTSLRLIAEIGEEKTVLTPFLNTSDDMEVISNSYNDDNTFNTTGLEGFMYNGIAASTLFISSNHWLGFGTNGEQLKILRRDGCSTAIYRQLDVCSNGLEFLKIRFEGYTVYNNRIESNRLIFELFLLGNNDMFLNVIQTPTSSNTGTSEMICNGSTLPLSLADSTGEGGGTQVSFYHQDTEGRTWDVRYAMYETTSAYSFGYLLRQNKTFFTVVEGALQEVPIENLTAAMFLKYGCAELPPPDLLIPIANPQVYRWQADGEEHLLKATLKAYPYPSIITSVVDMSHISILGIKLMTAQYSGDVGVCQSLDNGTTFSEEMPLADWLNTDPEELYNSLNETKVLILRFVIHDNATISRFKITYIN